MLTAPVRIDIEKNGDAEKVTASCTQEGVFFSTPGWVTKGEDEIWVVKVNNSSGYELPSTGGPGTKLFYLYGTMLTVLATTGLLLKGQKKKAA